MSIKRIAVAAVALAIGGVLSAPAAVAGPERCDWKMPGQLELDQDDGWHITVPIGSDGTSRWRLGGARYSNPDNPDWAYGDHGGKKKGNNVVIDVEWSNDTKGHYDGYIYQDGIATGQSTYFNEAGKQTFNSRWSSSNK